MKPCATCKFFKRGEFFGLFEPTCLNPKCVDPGFTHTDKVTGAVRVWPSRQMPCYKARFSLCGPEGKLHEST